MSKELLKVSQLRTSFFTRDGEVQSVRGVSFAVEKGEVVGIVGESGSGKSVTAKSIMSLIGRPGKIVDGEIWFQGEQLLDKKEKEWRAIRGNRIAMIFQDPMTSLNPVLTIGKQMTEVIVRHKRVSFSVARAQAIEMLERVGIPSPERRIDQYPHEFSGGMRQRVMIAMALSCEPELLIADEPTTALDVTIQAQILDLMKELKQSTETAIMLITHDLGVVAQVCSRVIVMYGGLIMEEGTVEDIFYSPQHPYTNGLLRSIPKSGQKERLTPIEGTTPNLLNPPTGCPFAERCPHAMDICQQMPPVFSLNEHHHTSCWLADPNRGEQA
ncbi:oligopeptide/dipeptide ABC transporter, ATP-binding protein, C-terminal domain-containing protein [Paenibacillus sp. yr247]|uniref:ABC transporter ATP-binding protein n=1 Tax=Paenibacillus sp. yr247 TaxID=1761880 RepID=UPI0008832B1F|nr:ABC transporter ATP-binding protein [Paenibacillus sp. yr247]SDM79022.1 oligopeptide/dipeptide ABC transporter, ATP-binding protein, C-terminal domain-containing protein [Paenibacillus sp. yr247]